MKSAATNTVATCTTHNVEATMTARLFPKVALHLDEDAGFGGEEKPDPGFQAQSRGHGLHVKVQFCPEPSINSTQQMKIRLLGVLTGLAVFFALPAFCPTKRDGQFANKRGAGAYR